MFDKVITIIACIITILIVAVIISFFYVNEQNTAKLKCVIETNQCNERMK